MYRLVEFKTGKVLQVCNGDYLDFLNNKWGGMFPFKIPGTNLLSTGWGRISGCRRYDAYWGEIEE